MISSDDSNIQMNPTEHFVARQPIFDRDRKVYAYELLFRSGLDNYFCMVDGDMASSQVIADSFLVFGIENVTAGSKAFINFTRRLIVEGYASVLPKEFAVIEILENVEPDQEVVARLSGRRTCKGCGAMYHVKFNKPQKEGVCDKCQGELYQRDDDNEETITSRLKVYHDQTSPLKDYYGKKGLVSDVPGQGEIDGIFAAVIKALES